MKFLLPFYDDSTLIFAATLKRFLGEFGHDATAMWQSGSTMLLSERQVSSHFPQGPDFVMEGEVTDFTALNSYDGVIVCKSTTQLRAALLEPSFRNRSDRPAFVAFYPGLEFTPEKGMKNRSCFDIVFLNNSRHLEQFKLSPSSNQRQIASYGHPYYLSDASHATPRDATDIVFFAQAISPTTYDSRRFMVDVLATIAKAHPDRRVVLKLRHLKAENTFHAHREIFDYQTILEDSFPEAPSNIHLTALPAAEVLEKASICITCTSTAAMDALSRGIPTMVYLNYPQFYEDSLVEPMRAEFAESGVIASLSQILHLSPRRPHKQWMSSRFRKRADLEKDIVKLIETFKDSRGPVR